MPRLRLPRVALLAIAVLPLLGIAGFAAERPNILLIFADDLGYGDLGCFGSPTIVTPNLDGLAQRGVKLTSFYSAPSCVPARVQLLLGKYPGRVDLRGSTGAGGKGRIPDTEVTLAEVLKGAGYETAMVGKWHLGSADDRSLPVGRGFDSWFGLPYSNDMVKPWVQTDAPLWLYENTRRVEHPVEHDTLLQRYTARAVELLRKQRATPFFLYVAPAMPHLPLAVSPAFRGKSRGGLYGDVIQELDWAVGEMLKALRESGQERNTIVIFTSDNGPWINAPPRMLQAGILPWHVGSAGALRESKGSTYEGGVRVPAIIHWPGHFEGGRTLTDIAATLDVYATLVALGTGAPPKQRLDGYDLTAFLSGRVDVSPRNEFFYFASRQIDAVRVAHWKLRVRDGPELFNLGEDPWERHNRAKERADVVAKLTTRIEKMSAETGARRERN